MRVLCEGWVSIRAPGQFPGTRPWRTCLIWGNGVEEYVNMEQIGKIMNVIIHRVEISFNPDRGDDYVWFVGVAVGGIAVSVGMSVATGSATAGWVSVAATMGTSVGVSRHQTSGLLRKFPHQ